MSSSAFSQRLKELRMVRGLTKEEVCEDEAHLSVRQLTRLEAGKSQPTLATMEYLADRLQVGLAELTGKTESAQELPAAYQKLKYNLIRTTTYGDPKLLSQVEHILDQVFDNYYDDLPLKEQVIIDIIQSSIYVYTSGDKSYGKSLFESSVDELKRKQIYDVNDIYLIKLYQTYIDMEDVAMDKFDIELFNIFAEHLLNSVQVIPSDYLFLLRDTLITIPYIEIARKQTLYTETIIQTLNEIMDVTQDFQKEPLVKMLEWKYQLLKGAELEQAKSLFEEAILLAKLFKNNFLAMKLTEEWEVDVKEHT